MKLLLNSIAAVFTAVGLFAIYNGIAVSRSLSAPSQPGDIYTAIGAANDVHYGLLALMIAAVTLSGAAIVDAIQGRRDHD